MLVGMCCPFFTYHAAHTRLADPFLKTLIRYPNPHRGRDQADPAVWVDLNQRHRYGILAFTMPANTGRCMQIELVGILTIAYLGAFRRGAIGIGRAWLIGIQRMP